jgi:hypothetical protein
MGWENFLGRCKIFFLEGGEPSPRKKIRLWAKSLGKQSRTQSMPVHRLGALYVIFKPYNIYRVYKKKRNLGISQEIDIVLKTKDFRRLGI